jgi:amino acid permease
VRQLYTPVTASSSIKARRRLGTYFHGFGSCEAIECKNLKSGKAHAEIMEQEADRGIASGGGGRCNATADDPWRRSAQTDAVRHGLMALGIGNIIGAGIFVLTGQAAAAHAGPAIGLSFVISAIPCAFAGMCYAEMASSVPISGSAYTYAYATMGEIIAPRIRVGGSYGGNRLVRLCRELSQGFWHHGAGYLERGAV